MATILIVDDQPVNRELLVTLLGYAGHRLLEADNAADGLNVARAEQPEMIITDIVMPAMDGYEFARRVRTDPMLRDTQVIFYTATYEMAEAQRLAEACGVAHIIAKPSEPEHILQVIEMALQETPPQTVQPGTEDFHQEHMRLLTDKLAAKVDELAAKVVELGAEVEARKRAAEALAASEAELRALFAAMTDVILVLGADGQYLKIAPTNPRFLYAPAPELLGRRLHDVFSPEQADFFMRYIRQALETHKPVPMDYSLTITGELLWFTAVISPMGPDRVFLVSRDVTAQRQAQEALRQSEQRYRLLFDSNPMPMWAYDLNDLRFLAVNDAAVEHYGYSREEFLRMTIKEIRPPDELPRLEANVATQRGQVEHTSGWRHRRKDGTLLEVDIFSHAIEFEGRPTRLVLAYDVTEQRRAEAQTARQLKRMAGLRAIDMAISGSLDLQLSLQIVLDQVVTQLQVDAADVLLMRGTNVMEYAAERGFRRRGVRQARLPFGQGYAGRVAQERRLLAVPDLERLEPDPNRAALFTAEGLRAYVGQPLIAKGQVVGVLEVFQRAPLNPDADWLDYFEALAGQAAIAIENAELFSDLQHSNQELSLAYEATIAGWSRALDLRDRETEGHSQRVTERTLELAAQMGMADIDLLHLRRGALLHDIGKMGVPDHILLKPGPLSDDEWVVMRQHPTFAYDMLSPIAYLQPALAIPYCHHEKWDGTGYPRGLAGDAIPLAARIFAVVDVWDALRSDRPYRLGWPEDQVREYVHAQAGKHFDPQVVADFERLLASGYA